MAEWEPNTICSSKEVAYSRGANYRIYSINKEELISIFPKWERENGTNQSSSMALQKDMQLPTFIQSIREN